MPQIPMAINSYKSRSAPLAAQRLVNMYAEIQPPQSGAKYPVSVFGCPGLTEWVRVGAGPIRQMWVMNDVLYVVSGRALFSVDENGVATQLGTGIAVGSNVVSMADNGTQVMVVDGTNGFVWDTSSSTFTQVSSVAFYACNTVTFFDSFFVFDRKGTNQFFLSDSYDGTSYDPLFFASAESSSDYVQTTVNNLQQLFIPGTATTELWYDQGGSGFPLARYSGAAIERGWASPFSGVKQDQAIFFLGDDLVFYRLQGATPIRVSTSAIETIFAQYGRDDAVSDAFCFTITWEGHKWIFVTFPSVPATWVYDITSELWHERESWDANAMPLGRWRANCYAKAYSKQLIGDYETNQIGIMDPDVYTEYGNIISGYCVSPIIQSERNRVTMGTLEFDMETGVGLTTGQGSDPQIMVDVSDNGGRTWSQPLLYASIGEIGEYQTRVRFTQMGQFYQRYIRYRITDPVKRTIMGVFAELEIGDDE